MKLCFRFFFVAGLTSAMTTAGVLFPGTRLLAQENGQNGQAEAEAVPGEGDALTLLVEGLTRFREGNYAEAAKVLEKAFSLNPTHDQIEKFMNAANRVVAMQMVRSADARLSGIGRQLLELTRRSRRVKTSDAESIKARVDKVFSTTDEQERMVLMIRGAQEFGRNLVPAVLPRLGNPETAVRTQAILWISKIESDALPPLLAAARHPNPVVRQNVAKLLGTRTIRHPFSLGTLKGMEADADDEVRSSAQESLQAILRDQKAKDLFSAQDYHLRSAQLLYLRPHKNPFAGPDYIPTVYSLKGEELEGEAVAPFQLSLRMAEAELVEALRIDPAHVAAKVQLVSNEALQIVEYDNAVKAYGASSPEGAGAASDPSGGSRDPEVKAILEKQKEVMDAIRRLRIKAYPADVLYAALKQSLREKRPEVAKKLIQAIHEKRLRGPVPEALTEALGEGSSRLVRIAAAIAIAYWNPEDVQNLGDPVIGLLSEAAVSSGVRTIHKAIGNADNASRLDDLFRELELEAGANYPQVADALQRAIELPPDLIVVDQDVRMERSSQVAPVQVAPVNVFINKLRQAYRTAGTPVVVLVDPARLEAEKGLYESDQRKVLVLPADCDSATFKTLVLERLFSQSDDQKAQATHLAARAAEALAHLTSSITRFPVANAVEPLGQVLSGRPDEVRIPSLRALGNLREAAAGALGSIAQVYQNAGNSAGVREAAMLAIGQILASGSEPAAPDILATIRAGMAEADPRLREASFMAFGGAGAADAEQLKALIDEARPPVAVAAAEKAGEAPAAGEAPEAGKAGEEKPAAGEAGADDPGAPDEKLGEAPAADEAQGAAEAPDADAPAEK